MKDDNQFPNRCSMIYEEKTVMEGTMVQSRLYPVIAPEVRHVLPHVLELGAYDAGSRYCTERKDLPMYLIVYTLDGAGILSYRGKKYTLTKDTAFWIDCREYQFYRTSKEHTHWHILWYHFRGGSSDDYYSLFNQANNDSPVIQLSAHTTDAAEIMTRMLHLYEHGENTLLQDITASTDLVQLMTLFTLCSQLQNDMCRIPPVIREVCRYIKSHYAEEISLDLLACRFHINKYHLLRQFKRSYGATPGEYMIAVRIQQAKYMLQNTNDTITAIAEAVGYVNTSHFINLFKQHETITPGAYRKSMGGVSS